MHSCKSCVSLYLFTHLWAHGDEENEFYSLFQRELSFQYFREANMNSFNAPASSLLQQWKSGKEQDSGRTTFNFPVIHAVINAIFSGYKMMVLLTYSYICWSESLLLIHCCLSCGIWWTEVCIFLQPCGITQGTNVLVKNISEINLLCESRILHITDCMARHIFLWKTNVLNVNSAEIIIQKSGMISSKSHRKLCIYAFVQVYLLNMHMAMPCPRTQ